MQDNKKTKAELITELEKLRRRVSALEKKSAKQKKAMDSLHEEFGLIERAVQGWKKTIDSAKTIMLLIGRDFRVRRVNLAASQFLGMSFHELLGRNCSELFLDVELSVEDCLIEKVVKTRKHEEAEFFLPGKNLWFLATVDPVLDDKGELSEIVQVIYDITDRKRAEEELREAISKVEEEKVRTQGVIAAIGDGISVQDRDFRVLYQNDAMKKLIGDHIGEFCYQAYERREDRCEGCPVAEVFIDGEAHIAERTGITDQGEVHVEITASPLKDAEGNIIGGIESVRDITERKKSEEMLRRLNRTLKMISSCNHALIHAQTEEGLLNEICRIVVQDGGYRMAWVGFIEHDKEKSVRPIAHAGFEDGYLEHLDITWADTERGLGPTGTALRTGVTNIAVDIQNDERFSPWRDEALRRGYNSSVALPLFIDKNVFGALNIYSDKKDAFAPAEIEILEEMAGDISYGINFLRNSAERMRMEKELFEREQMYRLLFQQSPVGIFHYDNELRITDCNDYFVALMESRRERLVGLDLHTLKDRSVLPALLKAVEGQSGNYEGLYRSTTGTAEIFMTLRTVPLRDISGNLLGGIGIVEDLSERKRQEDQIRMSEEKFSMAFNNSPLWFVISGFDDGRYIDVNETFLKQTGFHKEEVIGRTAIELGIWPDPREREEIVARLKAGEKVMNREVTRRTKDGRILIMLFSTEIINIAGKDCLLSISLDITDRKRAEQELVEIKQDWEDTFNIITDMITVHDKDFHIIRANKAAEKILGLPFLQTTRAKCYAYYHGTGKPPEGCPSCDCLVTGKAASFEVFEPHLKMFIEIRAIPRFDKNNNLIGLIHVVRDITERKRVEDELIFLALIVQNIPDAVCSIDLDARILSWNKGAEKMLGYSAEEIIGKHIHMIIPQELQQSELEHCLTLLDTVGYFIGYESQRITKDGRIIPVEITGAVLRDESGQAKRYSSIMKDITERKKIQNQLIEHSESLEQKVRERTRDLEDARLIAESANRAKSLFLANMSHELRTPLNAIIGFSEAFTAGVYGELREDHKEYINDILQSGMQLLSLINSILDLSRIETGSMELEYSECNVKDIVSVIYMFREKAKKHNIDLRIEVEDGIGTFMVDEVKIKQVIINLLSNAFKFTPDGGSVSVAARRVSSFKLQASSKDKKTGSDVNLQLAACDLQLNGDFIEISVEDTGIGIPAEDLQRIFVPFVQAGADITVKSAGAGLGLTLCRRFVEMHGGRIWAESPPMSKQDAEAPGTTAEGRGTRFIFVLPRKPSDDKLKQ